MKENIKILIRNFDIENWFEKVVKELEKVENLKEEQMSIVIVGDQRINNLNREYRQKNEVTDVLSFVQSDIQNQYKLENDFYLGEIFINFRQAERQYETNIKDEMLNLLVHGYLHLKGYTHNNNQEMERMKKLASKIITKLK